MVNTNTIALDEGIHIGLGMDRYHEWTLDKSALKNGPISCSMLKEFVVNPYAWLKADPKDPSEAMKQGSILDAALTEPDRLESVVDKLRDPINGFIVAPFPDFRTKEAREWKAAADAVGQNYMSQGQFQKEREAANALKTKNIEQARLCAQAVREHAVAGEIIEGSSTQVGAVTSVNGIPAKCLIDILPGHGNWEETLFDYKVTSNGLDDDSIQKTMSRFRLHWQAAFYRTVFNKASDDRICSDFGFIFQDPNTLEVRVVILDEDSMATGTRCIKMAVREFCQAAQRGVFSRYRKSADTLPVMGYTESREHEWVDKLEDPS